MSTPAATRTATERTGSIGSWWRAVRPRTLAAAAAPVLMGTSLAFADGRAHLPSAVVALLGAFGIQIGTNLANDYFDFVKGADRERIGPPRMTQSARTTPAAMRRAFLLAFALALVPGAFLIARGGWPIAVIGFAGIAAGILYTGGPRPLAYVGLGELFVLVFFGPAAVAGTYFVQARAWSAAAWLGGLAPGLLSTALLCVNNLRDAETDARAGKRTLAVRLGRSFAKAEIVVAVGIAALVPLVLWLRYDVPRTVALASLACVTAFPALVEVLRARPGSTLQRPLEATARLLVLYGLAFSLGVVLPL